MDKDPEFNKGFITDAQSTPPLCAAIFLFLTSDTYVVEKSRVKFDKSVDFVTIQKRTVKSRWHNQSAVWDTDCLYRFCIIKIVYVYNAVAIVFLPFVTILFICDFQGVQFNLVCIESK